MVKSYVERLNGDTLLIRLGDDWVEVTEDGKMDLEPGVTKVVVDFVGMEKYVTKKIWLDIALAFGAGLENVTTINLQNVASIGYAVFQNSDVEHVEINSEYYSIGGDAFADCLKLKTVKLTEGLTSIERAAFSGCIELTDIDIPNGTIILGTHCFSECKNLTTVELHEGLREINGQAFEVCENLETINIPETVRRIHNMAFLGCASLKSIIIPEGVLYVGRSCFLECVRLEEITLPSSLTQLSQSVFASCSGLVSISIPASIIYIGHTAFKNCYNLTTVELHEGLIEIGMYAFLRCTSLVTLSIPLSVRTIGDRAFEGCTGLQTVIIHPGNVNIAIHRNAFEDGVNIIRSGDPINIADMEGLIKGEGFVAAAIGSTNYLKGRITKADDEEHTSELKLAGLEEYDCNDTIDPISYEHLNEMEEGDTIIMNRETRQCYAADSLQGMIRSGNAIEPTNRQPMTEDDETLINTSTRMFVDNCL